MRLITITRQNLPQWQCKLEALEQTSSYPLGTDSFRLSHGANYLAFFERLGRVHYYGLEEDGQLLAVGCGILRQSPLRWYGADLKVHPEYRGKHLPIELLRRVFWQNYLHCGRGYGVAMDPTDGRMPPAVRLLAHFRWIPNRLLATAPLWIYSADAETMAHVLPLISCGRTKPHFVSLLGVKDLILASTNAPLPLLHVRFSAPSDERVHPSPQAGYTHMWCLPKGHQHALELAAMGIQPAATATIVYHRLTGFDWTRIDTSEI